MNFRKYVVTGVFAGVNAGHVKVSADQVRSRRHALTPVAEQVDDEGAGVYAIMSPVQFKHGEQFEYDGEFPKSMADVVADPKSAEAAEKAAAKTKGKKKSYGRNDRREVIFREI